MSEFGENGKPTELAGKDVAEHITAQLEECDAKGATSETILNGLVGIGNPRSFAMRRKFLEKGEDPYVVVNSLVGVGNTKAMDLREELLEIVATANMPDTQAEVNAESIEEGAYETLLFKQRIIWSLTGVDTAAAMDLRQQYLEEFETYSEDSGIRAILQSLAGLDSPRAWELRRHLSDHPSDRQYLGSTFMNEALCDSLQGVSSEEAMQWRTRLPESTTPYTIIRSLTGVGTATAMDLRQQYLEKFPTVFAIPVSVAKSLRGIDTFDASDLRERLRRSKGISASTLFESITGVGSPQSLQLRRDLIKQGYNPDSLDHLIYTFPDYFQEKDLKEAIDRREEIEEIFRRYREGENTQTRQQLIGLISSRQATKEDLASSLAGVNTKEADALREEYFGDDPEQFAKTFTPDSFGGYLKLPFFSNYGYASD